MRDLEKEYAENGYYILRNLFSKEEVNEIVGKFKKEIINNIHNLVPAEVAKHALEYDTNSKEFWSNFPAIQYMHKISETVMNLMKDERIVNELVRTTGHNIKCVQSIYFSKAPGSNGVPWHQDEYFLPTRDKSLIAAWIALEDADLENGGLQIVEGSHKSSILYRMVAQSNGSSAIDMKAEGLESKIINVELAAGDVVFFSGYLLHASEKNNSLERYRKSIVYHYMSADSIFPYAPGNNYDGKRKDPTDFRDIVMVSGNDYYSWKGIEDIHQSFSQKPRYF